MKTYKTEKFLDKTFVAVPRMKKALALKVSNEILEQNLTLAHILILREVIQRQSPSMKELVKQLGISNAMMTHFTDQLERKKFVKRKRSEKDRRVVHIVLTKKGKDMCEKIRKAHRQSLTKFLEKFSDRDRAGFITAFDELYRLIIKYGESSDE